MTLTSRQAATYAILNHYQGKRNEWDALFAVLQVGHILGTDAVPWDGMMIAERLDELKAEILRAAKAA